MVGSVIAASAEDRRLQDNGEVGVSIIVPMYNAATTIERTLASVCEQTYENLEIVVVDDGSRDASAEIVRNGRKLIAELGFIDRRMLGWPRLGTPVLLNLASALLPS